MQKTISVKRLISDLGENFSEHIKDRLLDLEIRCVLTRKEDAYKLDIKHVEHTKYDCIDSKEDKTYHKKEYVYGRLVVIDETLYFSDNSIENDEVMRSPIINTIYKSLDSEIITLDDGSTAKKLDDTNIDYVIDSILTVCPEVSQRYKEIMKDMIFHAERKASSNSYRKTYH
nr:hypothetical protein [Clostridium tetanomorphum]